MNEGVKGGGEGASSPPIMGYDGENWEESFVEFDAGFWKSEWPVLCLLPGLEQSVGYTPVSLATEKSGEDRNLKRLAFG